jgi:hypothetical protein
LKVFQFDDVAMCCIMKIANLPNSVFLSAFHTHISMRLYSIILHFSGWSLLSLYLSLHCSNTLALLVSPISLSPSYNPNRLPHSVSHSPVPLPPNWVHTAGKFRVPFLRGVPGPSVEHFRSIEQSIAENLDNWLCNAYLEVRQTEGRGERAEHVPFALRCTVLSTALAVRTQYGKVTRYVSTLGPHCSSS